MKSTDRVSVYVDLSHLHPAVFYIPKMPIPKKMKTKSTIAGETSTLILTRHRRVSSGLTKLALVFSFC